MTSLLILSSLVYPLTLLRKRISAASRRVQINYIFLHYKQKYVDRDSSVGIATRYGLDGLGIESR